LAPDLYIRKVSGKKVYSFYYYDEVEQLLLTKGSQVGFSILKILAKNSIRLFLEQLHIEANLLPIDDKVKSNYSHTAVIAHAAKTKYIEPIYGAILATNDVKYAGKSAYYRQTNKKGFVLKKKPKKPVIILDDIITTGSTMRESISVLRKNRVDVLFGITLATTERK
jgi:competence protein ComFC